MVMAMRPDLVRTDKLDADGERDGMRVPGVASYYRFDQRTRHGGVGDPRVASAEKGERMLDASAEEVAAQVLEIRKLKSRIICRCQIPPIPRTRFVPARYAKPMMASRRKRR